MSQKNQTQIRIALPKGRMQQGILKLLTDAGVCVDVDPRSYRPRVASDLDVKLLKPQSIVHMLANGSRDLGFTGADWVGEIGSDLVELLDTKLDPVTMVIAAPPSFNDVTGPIVVASEYVRLAEAWAQKQDRIVRVVRSYGATEVYPPDDADCIIDIAQSGATLKSNGLNIIEKLMTSSTRLYANARVLDDPNKRTAIEDFVMLLRSVIEARERVMLEMNVDEAMMTSIMEILPCMRKPSVSKLFGCNAFAVKSAVRASTLPTLIPLLKTRGASDIVVSRFTQIVL